MNVNLYLLLLYMYILFIFCYMVRTEVRRLRCTEAIKLIVKGSSKMYFFYSRLKKLGSN